MCKYIKKTEGFTARDAVNARLLAKDLAAELGGKFCEDALDPTDRERHATFTLNGARISVSSSYSDQGKASLSIDADVSWHKVGSMPYVSEYRQEMRTPSIKISVERPLATLAKDVRRRLIDAGADAVKARQAHYDSQVTRQGGAQKVKQDLASKFGELLDLRLEDRSENGTFYVRGDGPYCNGRFNADSSVTIDRIGSVSAEQFAAIVRILRPSIGARS